MRTAYRCRAYPDDAQQAILTRTFGCIRVVWNRILTERHRLYRSEGKGLSYAASDRALTAMKKEPDLAFLNEVSSVPLQQTLRHQQKAFGAFFARRAGYPRYKSRRGRQSATYTRSAFSMRDGELRLAKATGPLRFVWTWPDVNVAALDPTSVTVAKDPAGRWFVTFHVEMPCSEPLPATGDSAGVDVGLTHFAALSTGEKISHPRNWEQYEQRLKLYQRRLARCQKGSRNHAKARARVARTYARVTDARRDFLHKASTSLIQRLDVIAIEDLNLRGMVMNRSLARAISCSGWAGFRFMLEYKAERCGRTVTVVDRWYPSSKTCSTCGHRLASLSLGTRHWTCPECGTLHDRDINAARNILAAGLAATACGGDVSRAGTTRPQPPVKREPRPAREGISVLLDREECQRTRLHTGWRPPPRRLDQTGPYFPTDFRSRDFLGQPKPKTASL
jgi:putative transposase